MRPSVRPKAHHRALLLAVAVPVMVAACGQDPTSTEGGPAEFTAELTGIQVEASDGATIELGDVTTTNELWGVYAG